MPTLELVLAALMSATHPGPEAVPGDTVIVLRPGDRLVLENLSGEISVGAWERDELEVQGDEDDMALMVWRSGSTVRVVRDDRKGRRRSVDAAVRRPAWADVEIGGPSLDVRVEGMSGRVEVMSVSGDVWVENVGGPVSVRTMDGEIDLVGARAGVGVSSQSDDVRLRDAGGPVVAHSGSGDLALVDVHSASVRAETQDGDITFAGTLSAGGDYGFCVHDGHASIAIPSNTDARFSVSTFDGDFASDSPVRIERFTGGREFEFTLGEGCARVEIQVFDGEIRILERQVETRSR